VLDTWTTAHSEKWHAVICRTCLLLPGDVGVKFLCCWLLFVLRKSPSLNFLSDRQKISVFRWIFLVLLKQKSRHLACCACSTVYCALVFLDTIQCVVTVL